MVDGVTYTVLVVALPAPALQVYVLAPLAVSKLESPEQMVGGDADALTVGDAFTVTMNVTESMQTPFAPISVYVVVPPGVTTVLVVFAPPGDHVKFDAPDAVSVVVAPAHIVVSLAETASVGGASTTTFTVVESMQPLPSVPATV
jgi:hypothetical protein